MSYTKIYLHCVWSSKNRRCIIPNSFRPVLLSHFKEYCQSKEIYLDFVNAHLYHVHALISLGKQQNIAEVMHLMKGESAYWINKMKVLPSHFVWQDDYYAASVSFSHVNKVRDYIKNQDEHHKTMTWTEEIERIMIKNGFDRGLG
ncbi:MAG: transposase [Prolixibacteraceae bacterium]